MLQCFATLAGFCQHRQKQRVLAARLGCSIFDNYVAFDGNIDANCLARIVTASAPPRESWCSLSGAIRCRLRGKSPMPHDS